MQDMPLTVHVMATLRCVQLTINIYQDQFLHIDGTIDVG